MWWSNRVLWSSTGNKSLNMDTLNNKAFTLSYLQKYEALKYYDRILSIKPTYVDVLITKPVFHIISKNMMNH